jgi:hypothetical protein
MLLIGVVTGPVRAQTQPDPAVLEVPPNVIVITSDDHPWPAYGFMAELAASNQALPRGNLFQREKKDLFEFSTVFTKTEGPIPVTPNLDKLARRGMVYPIGHAAASVCHPSFQATLTGRYQRDFLNKRFDRPLPDVFDSEGNGVPHDPYYIVEYLNDALDAQASSNGTDPKEYRSLGYGKIWNNPRKSPKGYYNTGFDCGVRDKGKPRNTINPLLRFIAPADYPDTPYNGIDCETLPNTTNPFFIWYATNLPHLPPIGKKLAKNMKLEEDDFGATVSIECIKEKDSACIEKPDFGVGEESGESAEAAAAVWDERDEALRAFKARVEAITENGKNNKDRVHGVGYAANVMLLDYWIGELLEFLEFKGISDNTVILYWSDNGYKLPNSKRSIGENGFRTPILVSWPENSEISQGAPGDPNSYAINYQQVNAIDFVPTLVDFATWVDADKKGAVRYLTCGVGENFKTVKSPPQPVMEVLGVEMCRNRDDWAFDLPITIPENRLECGCLGGTSILNPVMERDKMIGEKRSKNGRAGPKYLRVLWEPNPPAGELCMLDGLSPSRCHMRIVRKRCGLPDAVGDLKIYDLLEDPDEKHNLNLNGNFNGYNDARKTWMDTIEAFSLGTDRDGCS